MNFEHVTQTLLQPSGVTAMAIAAAVFGLVLWWIVIIRKKMRWLPVLRRLDIAPKVSRRIRFVPPPWIPFLCFLITAIAMVLLSAKPQIFKPATKSDASLKSHLLVDLSPSMSTASLQNLARQAARIWDALAKNGPVTFGTTSVIGPVEAVSSEAVEKFIVDQGFARAGVRIAPMLVRQLAATGETDRIVILSDQDAHSWAGLNLNFFGQKAILVRVEPDIRRQYADNVFIDSVRQISGFDASKGVLLERSGGVGRETWEVEIARRVARHSLGALSLRHPPPERVGGFEVWADQRLLGRGSWRMGEGVERISVSIEIDGAGDTLLFKLDSDEPDAIKLDNEFRVNRGVGPGSIRMISAALGEGLLQDDGWQLSTVLELLGYQVYRHESAAAAYGNQADRWIVQGGTPGHLEAICPVWVGENFQKASNVWLAPRGVGDEVSWRELCMCHGRLSGQTRVEEYCSEVNSRDAWIALLPSLGARQIGGALGDERSSIAWVSRLQTREESENPSRRPMLTAFTVPLRPNPATGINHAAFPLILRDLLSIDSVSGTGARSQDNQIAQWPRITDSSERDYSEEVLMTSNVPIVESSMQVAEPSWLPPKVTVAELTSGGGEERKIWDSLRRDRFAEETGNQADPWPWVRVLGGVFASALLVESIWLGWRYLFPMITAVVFSLSVFLSEPVHAEVELIFLGSDMPGSFERLSREVQSRTSITINPVARKWQRDRGVSKKKKPYGVDMPWIWANGLASLGTTSSQSGVSLAPEFGRWLRRGGVLIVENVQSREELDRLFKGEFPGVRWDAVPTDHELMRSFYLLDGLPVCSKGIWYQFAFDGRVAAIAFPDHLSRLLSDSRDGAKSPCLSKIGGEFNSKKKDDFTEQAYRAFINLMMVALTTDYKKDQIHLPEILKRLR